MRRQIAIVVILLMACGARADPSARIIPVENLEFGAAPSGLRVGDVVEWRNLDIFRHSATADDGDFDIDLPAGGAGKVTLRRAGEISYSCRFHPGMKGKLTVAP
jgi:plastocyanin